MPQLTSLFAGAVVVLVCESRGPCADWTKSEECLDSPVHGSAMLQLRSVRPLPALPGEDESTANGHALTGHEVNTLESEELSSLILGFGKDAPLTEEGFRATSAQCCELAMDMFMRRLITDLEMTLCYEGGLNGFLPYIVCNEEYTLDSVTSELFENTASACSWVSYDEDECWAEPWPEDCNVTKESGYNASAHRRRSCQKKSTTTSPSSKTTSTTSTVTTTQTPLTVTATVDTCLPNSVVLNFSKSVVTQNNLGGAGPNFDDPEELRYSGMGDYNGRSLDLVVRTTGSGYRPGDNTNNGLNGKFGQINLGAGVRQRGKNESVDLRFTIEMGSTKEPVALPGFYMTFLDIDQNGGDGGNSKVREIFTFQGYSKAIYDKTNEDISVTEAGSVITVKSMKLGHGCDNPDDPDNLRTVMCQRHAGQWNVVDQMKRSIMFLFENVASLDVTFETVCNRCESDGRNMIFAAKSSMIAWCS